jgi:hypothetical protein
MHGVAQSPPPRARCAPHTGEGVQPSRPSGRSLRLLPGEFCLVRAQKCSNLIGHV